MFTQAVVYELPAFGIREPEGNPTEVCAGWFAAVQARKEMVKAGVTLPFKTDWEFSPPDD